MSVELVNLESEFNNYYVMILNYLFSFFWQSSDSLISSPPKLVDGRLIYYHVTDEFGEIDEGAEGLCITFKGNSVEDLKKRLEEETGLEDITVCTRSALNGKLYPLRLQLPPNNANMNVIILPSSSKGEPFTLLLGLKTLVSFRESLEF